uniref:Uncharacterized protein n=1 Tax=Chromera velia CCMP2878 TaxID=1169474 RepID=A0A0G4G6J4_9ALVE|eukprot:Cvel_4248.t1-p1 / transcript=Cvel_4248.t1 / gene=Cvel_4248 / organism=Chromera_velia_CCMP2878 / gene_product=hypothetical protein / transcript_product=hypothetical protein / location=Cvel_scaffold184:18581-20195(+) / protein_length=147 / sequence_SO=supercontig / SO=protein_coding / is_pseudo=false
MPFTPGAVVILCNISGKYHWYNKAKATVVAQNPDASVLVRLQTNKKTMVLQPWQLSTWTPSVASEESFSRQSSFKLADQCPTCSPSPAGTGIAAAGGPQAETECDLAHHHGDTPEDANRGAGGQLGGVGAILPRPFCLCPTTASAIL